MIYPVITLYQPWATWIMRGWKTIETRVHPRFACLNHKEFLIHAGQTTDGFAIHNPYLTQNQILYKPDEMVNGFILGKVYGEDFKMLDHTHSKAALIDCENTLRWGNFLSQIKPFEKPIPCKGEMGIWYYDMDKMEKVKKPSMTENQTALF